MCFGFFVVTKVSYDRTNDETIQTQRQQKANNWWRYLPHADAAQISACQS